MADESDTHENSTLPYINEGGVRIDPMLGSRPLQRGQVHVHLGEVEPLSFFLERQRAVLLCRGLRNFILDDDIRAGIDPHKAFACEIFGVPADHVTLAMRTLAKKISFARSVGVELRAADAVRDEIVLVLKGLLQQAYQDRKGLSASDHGYWCDACGETRVTEVKRTTCLRCLGAREEQG